MKDWQEGKIHKTLTGEFVRSKTELVIYNLLVTKQVPFKYEEPINGGEDSNVVPDFYFKTHGGEVIVWEHYGYLSQPSYFEKYEKKQKWYLSHNFVRGVNYFATFDGAEYGLDSTYFTEIVNFIAAKIYGHVVVETPFVYTEFAKYEDENFGHLLSIVAKANRDAYLIKLKIAQHFQRKKLEAAHSNAIQAKKIASNLLAKIIQEDISYDKLQKYVTNYINNTSDDTELKSVREQIADCNECLKNGAAISFHKNKLKSLLEQEKHAIEEADNRRREGEILAEITSELLNTRHSLLLIDPSVSRDSKDFDQAPF